MLRLIALITMLIDHIGLIFFPQSVIFRIIGRFAFPLFAWGIAQGYIYTKNIKKYAQRILLLALISQPIFFLSISPDRLNICFTLLFGLLAIYTFDKSNNRFLKIFFPLLISIFAYLFNLEYGAYGVLLILFFHIFKKWPHLILAQFILIASYVLLSPQHLFNIFAIFAIFLIIPLEKYHFKMNRSFQYLFYPLHLLLLYLIKISSLVKL